MITKFSVTNFKSFNETFTLNLGEINGYEFNKECIKNNVVNNALVYGHNGVGKSNLGLAIFDIIVHLTEYNSNENEYSYYTNAFNNSDVASFEYEFNINSKKILYKYQKSSNKIIISEEFYIDGEILAKINRNESDLATFNFKGTETLNNKISNNKLSILKYIKNNSILDKKDTYNETFLTFFNFIDGMLFFRSLQDNIYLGLEIGIKDVVEDIIENGNLSNFEKFLTEAGIDCKLSIIKDLDGKDILAMDFNGKSLPFFAIASQGTKALSLFYFWFQRLNDTGKVSFLFIDEFDAFYHHELSAFLVKELKKTNVQFILTTHNTSILTNDLLRPDCYFLMKKDSINNLSRLTSKELREAHNIEKMYKAGSFYE
ncbi:AAA family ATPase [Aureivirga sp. CE67]|uniref:AAA family ATPase n=1 Tax=Aureivirga sp. CE67 TaxID=1788983 RepID=UPI0018CBB59D|nr:ATP-binding protein [Aureivirga sp. CE67]